jgi:hypothetical protein
MDEDLAVQLAGSYSHLVNELWTKGQSNLSPSDMDIDVDAAAAHSGTGDGEGQSPSGAAALHVALLQACASAPHVFSASSSEQVTRVLCSLVLQGTVPLSAATLVAHAAQPGTQDQNQQQQGQTAKQQQNVEQLMDAWVRGMLVCSGGAGPSIALTSFGLACSAPFANLQPLLQSLTVGIKEISSQASQPTQDSILTACLQLVAAACKAAPLAGRQWLSGSQQLLLASVKCLQLPQAALQQQAVALVPLLLQPAVAMQLATSPPAGIPGVGASEAASAAAGSIIMQQLEGLLQQAGPQGPSGLLSAAHSDQPTLQLTTGVIQGLALLCTTLGQQDAALGGTPAGSGGTSCVDSVCLPALGCTAAAAYEAGAAVRGSMSREAAAAAAGGSVSSGRPTIEEVLARALLLLLRLLASDETRVTAVAHAALTAVAAALGKGVTELVLGRPLVLHGLSQLLQQPRGPGVLQQMESQLQVGVLTCAASSGCGCWQHYDHVQCCVPFCSMDSAWFNLGAWLPATHGFCAPPSWHGLSAAPCCLFCMKL